MADLIRPFLGRDRAAGVAHTTPPQDEASPPRRGRVPARNGRALDERTLDVLERLEQTTAAALGLVSGRVVNGVLEVATQPFPAVGTLTGSYGALCGSLLVVNSSQDPVTITAGLGSGTAPPSGVGVTIVPAESFLPVAIASNGWAAFGTAGDVISWTAFTGLQAFGILR